MNLSSCIWIHSQAEYQCININFNIKSRKLSTHRFHIFTGTQPHQIWPTIMPQAISKHLDSGNLIHVQIRIYNAFLCRLYRLAETTAIRTKHGRATTARRRHEHSAVGIIGIDSFFGDYCCAMENERGWFNCVRPSECLAAYIYIG